MEHPEPYPIAPDAPYRGSKYPPPHGWVFVCTWLMVAIAVHEDDKSTLAAAIPGFGISRSRRRRRMSHPGVLAHRHAAAGQWVKVHDLLAKSAEARKWLLSFDPAAHRTSSIYDRRVAAATAELLDLARVYHTREVALQAAQQAA